MVAAADEHADAMAAFFRRVWRDEASAAQVRASRERMRSNPVRPGEPYPTHLVLAGDDVVAYLSTLPTRFWIRGRVVPGWWAKGLMVLPEYRNGPLGALLVRELAKREPVLGSLAVNPPALRLFQAAGLTRVGPLGNRLIVLRPGNVLRRLDTGALPLDGLAGGIGRMLRIALKPGFRQVAAVGADLGGLALGLLRGDRGRVSAELPEDVDRLWERVRGGMAAGVVRDREHFARRFGAPSEAPYVYVTVAGPNELLGLGVVRAPRSDGDPRLKGIRVAVLSEAIFPLESPESGRRLLACAERAALELGADALLASGTHRAFDRVVARRPTVDVPANVQLLLRVPGIDSLPPIGDWWLTRGDGDADGVF